MRAVTGLSMLCGSFLALAGCTEAEAPDTGELTVNLVGQGGSGSIYRLRDATIIVDGPNTHRVFNTEDDLARTAIEENVIPGDYVASLQPGWRLERVEGQSTTTIEAQLVTPNPSDFEVVEGSRTIVPLTFFAFDEEIDLATGYGIVLGVIECRRQENVCGDGNDEDCDGLVDCADPDCTDDILACPQQVEVEPNEDGTPSTSSTFLLGNDFATANADLNGAITDSTMILASISPAGDEDVYAFENPSATQAVSVRFDVWNPSLGVSVPCGSTTDTALVIRDATAAVLLSNDDRAGSADRCSTGTISLAPGQRLYAQINRFIDNNVISAYALQVTYTPAP